MNTIERFPIVRISEEGENDTEDVIAKEFSLTIILNSQELATLLCSPANLKYLAIGFVRGKKMNIYTNRWRVVAQKHE